MKVSVLLLLLISPPASAWMADPGESYYAVPIKGSHNAAMCRKLEKVYATLQNDCHLPRLPVIAGNGHRPSGRGVSGGRGFDVLSGH